MPAAKSAVSEQPRSKPSPRRRRYLTTFVGSLVGVALLLPANAINAPGVAARAGANNCDGWNSTTRPPDYVRVLRRQSGKVERVPFKKYVITVLGKEWPSYLPQPVVEAGAVAVKQYAWYHTLGKGRQTSDGRCFDVRDGTGDQLYKPNRARVRQDHYRAVDATWGVRLLKNGRLFMTGYRRGNKGNCGSDATGWKLFARSATRCAYAGKSYRDILRIYYSPGLEIIGGAGGGASAQQSYQQPSTSQSTSQSSTSQSSQAPTTQPAARSTGSQAAPSSDARVVDDRNRNIVWHGSWTRVRSAGSLGRTMTYSGLAGSSATFRFDGRSLEIIGRRGPWRGWFDVYINGKRKQRVDLWATSKSNQETLFSSTWRRAKERTVRLVVVGNADRPRADLDAIIVR